MSKKIVLILPYIVAIFLLVDFYLIFIYAPQERTQGLVQKIFYFHVSSAFAMYAGFLLAGFFAIRYLLNKDPRWNALSHSGVSVGLLFCTMVLASGPVWAKPVWGAWWTWDPRLTTTMLVWLIFMSTLFLRRFYGRDQRGAVYAAVLTLFGVLDIPLIFFSVKLWRGIHPSVLGQKENMPLEMKITLIFTNLTVLFLFGLIYWIRYKTLLIEEKVEILKEV